MGKPKSQPNNKELEYVSKLKEDFTQRNVENLPFQLKGDGDGLDLGFDSINALNVKERAFAWHYSCYSNCVMAYLFSNPGAKYETAKVNGLAMKKQANIASAIEFFVTQRSLKLGLDKDQIVYDLKTTAEMAKKDGKYFEYAKIMDMIIKIFGIYEASKIQHTGNVTFDLIVPGFNPAKSIEEQPNTGQPNSQTPYIDITAEPAE